MKIFILAILVVSIISLCFFKKKFWENRYLVLLFIGGVALVATLTSNYATRNKLGTKVETISKKSVIVFGVNTSLIDSTYFTRDDELGFKEHLNQDDSTKACAYSRHLFYYNSDGKLCVGFAVKDDLKSKLWTNVYIAPSTSDSLAYYAKERQYYNDRSSKWIANISLPYIKTINCLYLPPTEYSAIPDSLIREIPF